MGFNQKRESPKRCSLKLGIQKWIPQNQKKCKYILKSSRSSKCIAKHIRERKLHLGVIMIPKTFPKQNHCTFTHAIPRVRNTHDHTLAATLALSLTRPLPPHLRMGHERRAGRCPGAEDSLAELRANRQWQTDIAHRLLVALCGASLLPGVPASRRPKAWMTRSTLGWVFAPEVTAFIFIRAKDMAALS